MKQEQAVELLVESGLIKPHSVHIVSITSEVYTLIRLVEQATLERAAKVCDEDRKNGRTWQSARKIRALKDSND